MSSSFLSGGAPGVSQGIGLATSVILGQLAQHTARVADATSENQAVDQIVPAFDADIHAIVAAYNSGEASAAVCIQAAQEVDANIQAYLKKQVGKPGTAWTQPSNLNDVPCNKTCTVGCCVYYGDIRPGIYGATEFANGTVGLIPVIQKGGGTVYIPEVYPGSYSAYTRASYTLQMTTPPPHPNVAQQILTVQGVNVVVSPPVPSPVAPTVSGASTSLVGLLTNNTLVTIVTLVGGILIILAYLFGSNAVRVK
jgi:hypothetical protein